MATALKGTTANFNFSEELGDGDSVDILVAFALKDGSGIEIADMHITNNSGGSDDNTHEMTIEGHGLVKLVGVTLGQIEGASGGSHDVDPLHGA